MHLTKMAQHAYLFFYGTHEFADFSELNKRTMAYVATIYLFFGCDLMHICAMMIAIFLISLLPSYQCYPFNWHMLV
jgi:hypothetical protein